MTANPKEVREWLTRAKNNDVRFKCGEGKITHVFLMFDIFDGDYFPVYIGENENVKERYAHYRNREYRRIVAIFNMEKDIDEQLREKDPWHLE